MPNHSVRKNALYSIFIVVFGATLFWLWLPLYVLDPGNIEWIFRAHPAVGEVFLGWHLYRFDDWHWPITHTDLGNWPEGFNIQFMSAIPLISIPLKVISPALPEHFQFIGIWHLIVLYANFGAAILLLRALDLRGWYAVLGAALLVLFPPLFDRGAVHTGLTAHFIILLTLYFFVSPKHGAARAPFTCLAVLACFVQLYFAPVVLLFAMLKPFFDEALSTNLVRAREAAATALTAAVALGLTTWFMGYFDYRGQGWGFGHYSMNLNAILNSQGRSRILEELPLGTSGQYEGYQYWGLGWFLIIGASLLFASKAVLSRRQLAVVIVAVLALAVFALSNKVYFGNRLLFEYNLSGLEQVASVFRSSGRFYWAAGYVICALAIAKLDRSLRLAQFSVLIALGIGVQLADVRIAARLDTDQSVPTSDFESIVEGLPEAPEFVHLGSGIREQYYRPIVTLMDRRIPTTMKYMSRRPAGAPKIRSAGDALRAGGGFLGTASECVLTDLEAGESSNYRAYRFDKDRCFAVPISHASQSEASDFPEFATQDILSYCGEDCALIISVKDEAAGRLSQYPEFLEKLSAKGSKLGELGYRDSYIGVFENGELIYEEMGPRKLQRRQAIGEWGVEIISAGKEVGDICSVRVGGQEVCTDRRGLNFVMLRNGDRIEAAQLDTH